MSWQNGRTADLPGPAGWSTLAMSVNDHGLIGGYGAPADISQTAGYTPQPIVWRMNQFTVLPSPGFDGARAEHVDNRGMIAGLGFRGDANVAAVYWSPVGPTARPSTGSS
jgi:hypothetical protein